MVEVQVRFYITNPARIGNRATGVALALCPFLAHRAHHDAAGACSLCPRKRAYGRARPTSANDPQRTFGTASFEHLVSAHENGLWYRNPESVRGLEVYDQLEFCRNPYRQIGGFLALQDATRINANLPDCIR